ncbi:MAG: ribonuclease activity regulator RraA, partial [Rhodospirillales bacterium]
MTLKPETREKLLHVSAATLTTALFKRGYRNTFLQNVHPVSPKDVNMVGPAYTLRYIPAREDLNHITVFDKPGHPQRVAVEEMPAGHVLVMD